MSTKSQVLALKYLAALEKNPLLTKSITGAVLAFLNELIATVASGQYNVTTIKNLKIKHPFSSKVVIFTLYSFFVGTPLTHYAYVLLNKVFKAPLSSKQKLLQILTAMVTITPALSAVYTGFVGLLNMKPGLQSLSGDELKRAVKSIKETWKMALFNVIKSSWVTSPLCMIVCQKFVPPLLWTVFNNVVYFFLGTVQNSLMKIKAKQAYEYQKKRDETVEKIEKEADKSQGDAPSEVLSQSTTTGADAN